MVQCVKTLQWRQGRRTVSFAQSGRERTQRHGQCRQNLLKMNFKNVFNSQFSIFLYFNSLGRPCAYQRVPWPASYATKFLPKSIATLTRWSGRLPSHHVVSRWCRTYGDLLTQPIKGRDSSPAGPMAYLTSRRSWRVQRTNHVGHRSHDEEHIYIYPCNWNWQPLFHRKDYVRISKFL